MKLIPITEDGSPAEPVSDLPEIATQVMASTAELYGTVGYEPPWTGYLAVEDGRCVGTCAFKAPPRDGDVEIAYFTFPQHEGGGIATSMAALLVAKAHGMDGITVTAQTLPAESASTTILQKLGFERSDDIDHPEDGLVWSWRLP